MDSNLIKYLYSMENVKGTTSCSYLGTAPGICKLATIILGAISVGVGSFGHFESFYIWQIKEEAFLSSTVSCLGISLFYFLANLSSLKLQNSSANRIFGIVFHLLAGVLLMIVGSLTIESTVEIDRKICRLYPLWPYSVQCQLYTEKLVASIIAVVNGLLYAISALLIFAT